MKKIILTLNLLVIGLNASDRSNWIESYKRELRDMVYKIEGLRSRNLEEQKPVIRSIMIGEYCTSYFWALDLMQKILNSEKKYDLNVDLSRPECNEAAFKLLRQKYGEAKQVYDKYYPKNESGTLLNALKNSDIACDEKFASLVLEVDRVTQNDLNEISRRYPLLQCIEFTCNEHLDNAPETIQFEDGNLNTPFPGGWRLESKRGREFTLQLYMRDITPGKFKTNRLNLVTPSFSIFGTRVEHDQASAYKKDYEGWLNTRLSERNEKAGAWMQKKLQELEEINRSSSRCRDVLLQRLSKVSASNSE